jgi:deazaflavin-dependent oxidoreductase (nitroreductase family)
MVTMAWSRSLARFNKKVTNRVQGLWAPYLPPWAMIVHKGRRSGRVFQTPVVSARDAGRLEIVLWYGDRADWVRNVLAAGGAEVRRSGRTGRLTNPRVVDSNDPMVSSGVRRIAGRRRRVLVADFSD